MKLNLFNWMKTSYFYFSFVIFIGCAVFDRSFVGLKILDFRLGEIIVGGFVVLSFLFLISPKKVLFNFNLEIFKNEIYIFKVILIYFLFLAFLFRSNLLEIYVYKSASYIWFIVSFFLLYSCKNKFFKFEKYIKLFSIGFLSIPFVHYFFPTGYYPDFIMNFFSEYSDKFTFTKGSDIMIVLLMVNLLFFNIQEKKFIPIIYFSISVPLLLPLLLEMSRASFLATLLFYFLFYLRNYKILTENKVFFASIILISITVFSLSTLRISGVDIYKDSYLEISISENIEKIAKKEESRKAFLSFYIQDGRVMSRDNTTNWRLDIWQDVIDDLRSKNQILYGYGYNEIIPVMTDPSAPGRLGRDGLNEHVHSYIFNILARGGILQLVMFAAFHIKLIQTWYKKYNDLSLLIFVLPVVLNSLSDMNMEGVQFPFMYFYFLAYLFMFYNKNNKTTLMR